VIQFSSMPFITLEGSTKFSQMVYQDHNNFGQALLCIVLQKTCPSIPLLLEFLVGIPRNLEYFGYFDTCCFCCHPFLTSCLKK